MGAILAPQNWPRGYDGSMVRNGTLARARHGIHVEQALLHVLGFGWPLGASVQAADSDVATLAVGDVLVAPMRIMPCASDVEVWVLAQAATANEVAALTVAAGGVSRALRIVGTGLEAGRLEDAVWQSVVLPAVGNGKPTTHVRSADSGTHLTLTNSSASATVYVYAIAARQAQAAQVEEV